jgi:hypothetical protein
VGPQLARTKLGRPELVATVRGVGYRLGAHDAGTDAGTDARINAEAGTTPPAE